MDYAALLRRRRMALSAAVTDADAELAALLRAAAEELAGAEERLRVQNELLLGTEIEFAQRGMFFREVFEGLPTAGLVTSPDGTLQHANTAACLLLRRPLNAIVRRRLATFVHPDHRVTFREVLQRARTTAHLAEFGVWLCPRGDAPCECRMWVRTAVTLGGDGPLLLWSVASLLPAG
jgi:PAS domain-containing protein